MSSPNEVVVLKLQYQTISIGLFDWLTNFIVAILVSVTPQLRDSLHFPPIHAVLIGMEIKYLKHHYKMIHVTLS